MQGSSVFFCLLLAGSCGLCLGFSPNPSRIPLLAGGRAVGAKSSPRSQGIVDLSMVSQDRRSMLLQLPLLVAGVALAKPQAARAEALPVTVIGPSGGNLGSEVVASMVRKNIPVRTVFRSERSLPKEVNPDGKVPIQSVVADVTLPQTLSKAVAGSRAVVFAAGSRRKSTSVFDGINSDLPTIEGDTPDNVDNAGLINVAKECIKNRVPRLIIISQAACTEDPNPNVQEVCAAKMAGEQAVRDLYASANIPGVTYTIARAGKLLSGMRRGVGDVELNQGDSLTGFISRADMADLVAELVVTEEGQGSTFEAFYTDTANPTNFKKTIETCMDSGKSARECMFGPSFKNKSIPNMSDVIEGRASLPELPSIGLKTGKERTGKSWTDLIKNIPKDEPSSFSANQFDLLELGELGG